jgi:hypothetical protein
MGILDLLFGKRPEVSSSNFPVLIPKLSLELEVIREQFLFGWVTALKGEDAPISGISPILQKGSELDAALKAYQLTCIVGFAWNYMAFGDRLPFDEALTQRLDDGDVNTIKSYREHYLDCQGNIELLSTSLAEDIYRMWGNPQPSFKFKRALGNAAITLGIISQATAARTFGDIKAERKLKSKLRI